MTMALVEVKREAKNKSSENACLTINSDHKIFLVHSHRYILSKAENIRQQIRLFFSTNNVFQ